MLSRMQCRCRESNRSLRNLSTSALLSSDQAPSQGPPLLLRIRNDLKTAMRAKDANRLSALRSVLSDVTNSSKTSNPINTDIQLLGVLRKRVRASQDAAEELGANGRQEMKVKEEEQIAVLEEYASSVQTVSDDEIRERVGQVMNELAMEVKEGKAKKGEAMKRLLGPGGVFEGKPVEKKDVVNIVDLAIGTT
ncbi:MAG: hypothetical protein M1831_005033 [Alyxoria varia]|nr:MAG: hypothetical protein M1831_005033 [Alyxoria varia]